jgi:hypothetical protein
MTVTKLFRFELTIKVDINVEEIKETDYGRYRYSKQLLNHLLKDPEAVRAFIIIYFMAHFINDNEGEISKLINTGEKEDAYILRAANKCPPEAQSFFKDLIVSNGKKKKGPKSPVFGSDEASENEWLFSHLHSKLSNMVPIEADFNELPEEILFHDHDTLKKKERKRKIVTGESALLFKYC